MKLTSFSLLAAVLGAGVAISGANAQQCACTATVTISLGVGLPTGTPKPPVPAPAPVMSPAPVVQPPPPSMPPMPSMTVKPMPAPSPSMSSSGAPMPSGTPMNPAGSQPPLPPAQQDSTAAAIVAALNGVANASRAFDLFIQPLDANPFTAVSVAAQAPIKFGELAQMAIKATAMLTGVKGTITAQGSLDVIVSALVNFVKIHQNLLQTIIGKKGLIAKFGFLEPVRIALVALEKAVDGFAFALIGVIPSKQNEGMMQRAALDQSLEATIKVYSS